MTQKIENIEQICLSILAENKDPWVPLNKLIEKCREIMGDDSVDESIIISFLKNHSEVKIFDTFYFNLPEIKDVIKSKELKPQPYVILKRRLPNERDMFIWMYKHLEKLLNILENMEKEDTKKQEIGKVINKTRDLLERLKSLSSAKNKAE